MLTNNISSTSTTTDPTSSQTKATSPSLKETETKETEPLPLPLSFIEPTNPKNSYKSYYDNKQQQETTATEFEKLAYKSSTTSSFSSSPTSISYSSSIDSVVKAIMKKDLEKSTTTPNNKNHIDNDNSFASNSDSTTTTTSMKNDETILPNEMAATSNTAILSQDKERQMLLLMLLAQVCSLHDATPKTFTVHVMNLLERGIINKDCVSFLLDLGLDVVPFLFDDNGSPYNNKEEDTKEDDDDNRQVASHINKSWSVEEHPLSLSRYQREFQQIRLINSGSFGDVYHVKNNFDGVEYAIKKVMFPSIGFDSNKNTTNIQNIIREVQCLAKCDHVNTVRYYTSWLEPSWMTGGNNDNSVCNDGAVAASASQLQRNSNKGHKAQKQKPLALLPPSLKTWEDEVNWVEHELQECSQQQFPITTTARNQTYNYDKFKEDSASIPFEFDDDDEYSEWSYADDSIEQQQSNQLKKLPSPYSYHITLYIQMQLCHPSTLSDWIMHRNTHCNTSAPQLSSLTSEMHIFHQIIQGVQHFHSKGIVHRDLKPSNIFLADDGIVKIGDFGLSKIMHSHQNQEVSSQSSPTPLALTDSPHFWNSNDDYSESSSNNDVNQDEANNTIGIGTISYAAPEQINSNLYGPKADIFSLGIILLELVNVFQTGHERAMAFQLCRNNDDSEAQSLDLPFLPKNTPNTAVQNISSLILDCTNADPIKRPNAKSLNHYITFIQNDISSTPDITSKSTSLTTCMNSNNNCKIRMPIECYNRTDAEVQSLKCELHKSKSEVELQKEQLIEKDLLILELQKQVQKLKST